MSTDPTLLDPEKPELIFGWVAPVGTPLSHLSEALVEELQTFGYTAETIRLSSFLSDFDLPTPEPPPGASEFERLDTLMTRGDELRERADSGEILALLAAGEIRAKRPHEEPRALPGHAFILSQLKNPDEVIWLRSIYGHAFHLIAVHCPEELRKNSLRFTRNMTAEQAAKLIERDRGEESKRGQQVTETFQHADVFLEVLAFEEARMDVAKDQMRRYLQLLFGYKGLTPTRDEYGMYLAQAAALRTADLSRQVGAAILTPTSEVISLGTNEVPAPGGGQYWEDTPNRQRDWDKGGDENTKIKFENLEEFLAVLTPKGAEKPFASVEDLLAALTPEWASKPDEEKEQSIRDAKTALDRTRMMNLTEFGRPVHAEMDAILSAGRMGVSVKNQWLYCTTFPCHSCAKHIVASGIKRVIYIEPYPKSLAERLHGDALVLGRPEKEDDPRVVFEPFRGVAPRMYSALFSSMNPVGTRIKRKNATGQIDDRPAGLRANASPLTYMDREAVAAALVLTLNPGIQTEETNGTDAQHENGS